MVNDRLVNSFLEDLQGFLEELGQATLDLEENPKEAVSALFRVFHSLKAGASILKYHHFSKFSHVLENILSKLRDGKIEIEDDLFHFLFETEDLLKEFQDKVKEGFDEQDFLNDSKWMDKINESLASISGYDNSSVQTEQKEETESRSAKAVYDISMQFDPDIYISSDPLAYISDLFEHFNVTDFKVDSSKIPTLKEFDPYKYYLKWNLKLQGAYKEKDIEKVFLFLDENRNKIDIKKTVIESENTQKAKTQNKSTQPAKKHFAADRELQIQDYVRVHTSKLDEMLNLFGELVIGFSQIRELVMNEIKHHEKINQVEHFSRILKNFQDKILNIRMVSIAPLFNQFYRYIKEGSESLKKQVILDLIGEETEVDKGIVDKLGEPLKHLVRNSLDHGIESAHERIKLNKGPIGKITLRAEYREGNIIISVSDDGKGLDKDKILKKALEKNIIAEEELKSITDEQIYQLIFHPGFSTTEKVNEFSGRGVGMDVVKKNIEDIRGNIEIKTKPQKGTEFLLKLPLTLSIIEAIIFRIGKDTLAIPVYYIKEMLKMKQISTSTYEGQLLLLNLRGNYFPVFYLDHFFTYLDHDFKDLKDSYLIFLEVEGKKFFIPVDEILGEQQVVLKRMPQLEKFQNGIMGSSVLGNGDIVFILDIFVFFNQMVKKADLPLGKKTGENLIEAEKTLEHT